VEAELCVDTNNVFSTGFDAGAFISYRIACQMSSRIRAIAPVAGSLSYLITHNISIGVIGQKGLSTDIYTCNLQKSISVLHIHGTSDATIPYDGYDTVLYKWPSVLETIG
jgi:polyhydroxybutyrate depolymerase